MVVTIEGVITSKELVKKIKDNEEVLSTKLLLAQPGEKIQAAVRLEGDQTDNFEIFERKEFTGQLLTWRTRDGVDMMVSVANE